MDREQIVRALADLLDQHRNGLRGSMHQEPYKGDFFRLFAAAFNAGLIEEPGQTGYLSADALSDVLTDRFPETVESEEFSILHSFWGEWTYAWRRRNEIQR